ncbi:MAG: hypothetical protein WC464_00410 [Bdellovibrionales bacterium]
MFSKKNDMVFHGGEMLVITPEGQAPYDIKKISANSLIRARSLLDEGKRYSAVITASDSEVHVVANDALTASKLLKLPVMVMPTDTSKIRAPFVVSPDEPVTSVQEKASTTAPGRPVVYGFTAYHGCHAS